MPGLERRLKAELSGEVQFDAFSRGRYSTDASHYQIMPVGVVAPRTIEEADRAIAIARSEGATVLARGGGTSQAGQAVGESLVVDCSKYLTRILDLDVKRRRVTVEPGLARDHRRHGRQQLVRRALDALRHDARQRHLDRGLAGRRHARAFRSYWRQPQGCARAAAAARERSARHRGTRSK